MQRQYCGALGKTANCQLAVSLHRADEAAGTSQPLSWRLFLPESWADDPARCQRAGVPPGIVHQSKQDLALGLIDQALGWQSPPGVVLADEAYGGSFEWRAALRERDLFYCVRVPWTTTAWQEEPRFGEPAPVRRGFRAKRGPLLSPEPKHLLAIAQGLPVSAWKNSTWRQGTKGAQRSRFASLPVWAAHGWKQGPQPERVEEVALDRVAARRTRADSLLARTPAQEEGRFASSSPRPRRAGASSRTTGNSKTNSGLDHFEGRSWQGFHHHVALVTAAFVFLRQEQRACTAAHKKSLPLPTLPQVRRCSASRPHPPERTLSLVSHPLPPA